MNHAQQFAFYGCIGILCTLFWLWGHATCPECPDCPQQTINNQAQYFVYTDSGITKSNLLLEITKENILFPNIVEAQCFWETGHLKCDESQCCLRYNNLFGFRHENYISKENPMGYLFFKTQKASIIYYKKWQDKYYKSGNYLLFLDSIKYGDSLYIKNLKQIIK